MINLREILFFIGGICITAIFTENFILGIILSFIIIIFVVLYNKHITKKENTEKENEEKEKKKELYKKNFLKKLCYPFERYRILNGCEIIQKLKSWDRVVPFRQLCDIRIFHVDYPNKDFVVCLVTGAPNVEASLLNEISNTDALSFVQHFLFNNIEFINQFIEEAENDNFEDIKIYDDSFEKFERFEEKIMFLKINKEFFKKLKRLKQEMKIFLNE